MRPGSLALLIAGILAWVISFRLKLKQWEANPARGAKADWSSWS